MNNINKPGAEAPGQIKKENKAPSTKQQAPSFKLDKGSGR